MRRESREQLEARLARLGPERLAAELLDLADRDRDIERRIKLLLKEGDPKALGTELRRRIAGLKRSSRFLTYRESFGLAQQLGELVEAIGEKVLPLDAAKAFELADAFVATDKKTFERIDDSSGVVGDVYRDACRTWLEAAAGSKGTKDWVGRVYEVAAEDGYGVREPLLREAATLLSEHELRRLARRYETEAREAEPDEEGYADEAFRATVRLSLVAEALEDPVLYERSVTLRGGELNDLQRIDIARRYLEYGQPERAIAILEATRGRREWERWRLLAEAYGTAGRKDDQVRCLWQLLEGTPSFDLFEELMELLPAEERIVARERAKKLALGSGKALSGARFLLHLGERDEAERLIVDRAADLEGVYYTHLKSLAELAAEHNRPRIEVACYRALLVDILNSARSKNYSHAARYFRKLGELDAEIDDYGALAQHEAFVEGMRERHGRKFAFWRRVEE